jgi:hypothetical protein
MFDTIPVWRQWSRKMLTIRAVSDGALRRSRSIEEYAVEMCAIQQGAAGTTDMGRKTAAFWKMENLSAEFLKRRRPGDSLGRARLPLEIRPIAHCGMGVAAVEVGHFDPSQVTEVIESFSDPQHRLFAYEGSGAMLSLYERDMFGLMTKGFGILGLLPLAPLRLPDRSKFVRFFDHEIQRLIAHGYGRMLYFKNHGIDGALRAAAQVSFLDGSAMAQGIAFAFSMVNNSDLRHVFRAGERMAGHPHAAGFRAGLVYALEFWEWMAPGFLTLLRPQSELERELFGAAGIEIEECRRTGVLVPFRVQGSRFNVQSSQFKVADSARTLNLEP